MWRKRTLRTMIVLTTIMAIFMSTAVLVYAAGSIDTDELKREITESINSLLDKDIPEIVFTKFDSIEEEPEPCEPIAYTETRFDFELKLLSTSIIPEVESTIPNQENIIEVNDMKPEVTYHPEINIPALVQTLDEEDPLAIRLIETWEDGTCVYGIRDYRYTIPYNPVGNEPMVSMDGYVEKIAEVPHFIQQSYPYTNYGNHGTVSSHGCGITSCAMVYSYLLDHMIMPDELAEDYGQYNTKVGSDYRLFSKSAEDFGLEVKMVYNWQEVEEALKNGQVVIANVTSESIFTDGGHYIVYYGITDEGKILVNDPNIYNYGQWSGDILTEGFRNGFDQKYCKYSFPCWIYGPKDIENLG